jgi:hypothetical protein
VWNERISIVPVPLRHGQSREVRAFLWKIRILESFDSKDLERVAVSRDVRFEILA